jgi:hypothetical protein
VLLRNKRTVVPRSSMVGPRKAMVARRKNTVEEVAATRIMSSTTTSMSG